MSSVLAVVRETYEVCDALPGRERWRLAQTLRAHLRAVLRSVARSVATRRDVDRCAELERAISHCGHIDYLLTLVDTLEWLSSDDVATLTRRWQGLRDLLEDDVQGLSGAMTLRRGHERARSRVAIVLTSSIPASPIRSILPVVKKITTEELSLHDPSIIEVAEVTEPVEGQSLIHRVASRATSPFDQTVPNQTVPDGATTVSRRLRGG
ncbi:MAG: four helix bundle protein [Deltaproteobacteria bacterium]|nr:four helix bundle protein [Deltaproteobacteria bacterium]